MNSEISKILDFSQSNRNQFYVEKMISCGLVIYINRFLDAEYEDIEIQFKTANIIANLLCFNRLKPLIQSDIQFSFGVRQLQ